MNSNHCFKTRKIGIVTRAKWLMWVLVLFTLGFVSSVFAETTEGMLIMAPLNPEFVQWQQLHPEASTIPELAPLNPDFVQQQLSPGTQPTTTGRGKGHLPSPINRSHMRGLTPKMDAITGFISGVYPSSFDLRTSGDVTSVKNQGSCGACWAFGANASVESTTLMGGGSTYDYSENHMNVRHGFDPLPCEGGFADMAGAYMSRWGNTNSLAAGPVYEADDPYTQNAMNGTPPYTSVAGLLPRVHLQEFLVLPDRGTGTNNDNYKYALQNYGAVDVSIMAAAGMGGNTNAYWDAATNAYYYNGSAGTNHDVTLVGWDDNYAATNFSTIPPGNGAFIVKNSWGTSFGISGYFYLSYYDTKLSDAHVFIKPESLSNYTRSYLYDPFGNSNSVGVNSNSLWGGNVFTAVANEPVQAVAFNTPTVNTNYEVYIYTGVTSTPNTGVLEGGTVNTTGSFPYAGYHTLTLSRPVSLMAGQKFAVVVKFTTPLGFNFPVPTEEPIQGYDSTASASAGQSYVSSNGTLWTDITSVFANTNVNIRAFTVPGVSYLLTVAKTGAGSGTVTSNPAGISCGTDCSESYASATSVTLTATPSAGNTFVGWSGDCTGSSTCVVSMTAAKNVTATFNPIVQPVTTYKISEVFDDGNLGTGLSRSTFNGTFQFDNTTKKITGITGSIEQSTNYGATPGYYPIDPSTISQQVVSGGLTQANVKTQPWDPNGINMIKQVNLVVLTSDPTKEDARYNWINMRMFGLDELYSHNVISYTITEQTVTPPVNYLLTVTNSNQTGGTVTSIPTGIDCGTDCSESYASGTSVTLTATPSAGNTFVGWSGDCAGSITCIVQMTAAKNVTATFNTIPYPLTVTTSGLGKVTSNPAGIDCGTDCTENYTTGTSVTLTPIPSAGYTFAGWSGDCTGSSTCVLSMTGPKIVTATFNITPPLQFPLSVSIIGQGTVTSNPTGINCGADCSEEYTSGTSVTLTATPVSDYFFTGWSGACTGTTPSCVVSMTATKNVTATFQSNKPGGIATGMTIKKVVCSNAMTGQVYSIPFNNNNWDCTSRLIVRKNDSITMTITGTAN